LQEITIGLHSQPACQPLVYTDMLSYPLPFFLVLLFANSGSPLSTTSNPSDSIDRFSLPPYNPNNSPRSAEELLKTLVNPIEFDLSEEHYLHPESYPESGPFFDLHRTKNVTALKGVSTNLICRVRRLGNHTVSWIRYTDTSLLTVGRYTYTTDLRFEAFHSPHTDDWVVRLKNPRPSDSGFYGCQISTTPHRTQLIYLTVHEPHTFIIGEPDMYVDIGSMLNLSCVVSYTERPPVKVSWLHNGIEISFRGPRSGVSVITEKAAQTTIHLLMQGANALDSGVYECFPDNAPPAKIKVHILTAGNQVAGLQTNAGSRLHSSRQRWHERSFLMMAMLIITGGWKTTATNYFSVYY